MVWINILHAKVSLHGCININFQFQKKLHAITRLRQLFSKSLNYQFNESHLDYGITDFQFAVPLLNYLRHT